MNRQTRVAWAAGFIDGEGCVYVGRRLRSRVDRRQAHIAYVMRLSANQADMAPLLILKELWGGFFHVGLRHKPTHNTCYTWILQGRGAPRALQEMLPYLVVKRRQAELMIEFQRLVDRQQGVKRRLSKQDFRERDALKQAISALNGGKPRPQVAAGVSEESPQLRLVAS